MLFLFLAALLGSAVTDVNRETPDLDSVLSYQPPQVTQLYSADDKLVAEYALERRRYLEFDEVPELMVSAFLAAEDENFFTHTGVDYPSVVRAALQNLAAGDGEPLVGASTITQQVIKNVLLGPEKTLKRKISEAILAWQVEQPLSKETILEIYLNEVFLGLRSYGVAEAAERYFGKEVEDLSLSEAAFLAGLPKAPSNYHPLRHRERALARRDWVLDRMVQAGFVTDDEATAAKATDLRIVLSEPDITEAGYFTSEARQELIRRLGRFTTYHSGLSVRTSLDTAMQETAEQVLRDALLEFDRPRGWRGPVDHIDDLEDWQAKLADMPHAPYVEDWKLAVALSISDYGVVIGRPGAEDETGPGSAPEFIPGVIPADRLGFVRWGAGPKRGRNIRKPADLLEVGDVLYVEAVPGRPDTYEPRQVPELAGGLVALEPDTGRVLAVAGGFSFDHSPFNRATRAQRQPGSSFKPFIYAAALENGFTPATVVSDAPIAIDRNDGLGAWRPKNYDGGFLGPITLRRGLERSRNVMTVRLAQELTMPLVAVYANAFGVYDDMEPFPALALGAGETTLARMAAAYAAFANGGRRVSATFVDRVEDRHGEVLYHHPRLPCSDCADADTTPVVYVDDRLMSAATAYQMTSMMQGVVERGTGYRVKELERPVAGKTGTTNDHRDAWFVGFTPDLVVGVYVGFDNPRTIPGRATGGQLAAPIFTSFMKATLGDAPVEDFYVPTTVELIPVNRTTGAKVSSEGAGTILEAFNKLTPERERKVVYAALPEPETDNTLNLDRTSPSGVQYGISEDGSTMTYKIGNKVFTIRRD